MSSEPPYFNCTNARLEDELVKELLMNLKYVEKAKRLLYRINISDPIPGFGSVAINPIFTKLIIALKTASEDGKGGLDKKLTSHSNVFDAFRMSLQYWTSD